MNATDRRPQRNKGIGFLRNVLALLSVVIGCYVALLGLVGLAGGLFALGLPYLLLGGILIATGTCFWVWRRRRTALGVAAAVMGVDLITLAFGYRHSDSFFASSLIAGGLALAAGIALIGSQFRKPAPPEATPPATGRI
jgi:hypothetical protein